MEGRGWVLGWCMGWLLGGSSGLLGASVGLRFEQKLGKVEKSGEKSIFWKGGISSETELARKSPEYKIWRTSVFERDNYTCIHCGKTGGKLQADHIKPFSKYKELRFDINNGRTLCIECHYKTDTYGSKMLKYEQY